MSNSATAAPLAAYLRQQAEMGMPGYYFTRWIGRTSRIPANKTMASSHSVDAVASPPVTAAAPASLAGAMPVSADDKRAALRELYYSVKNCARCPLGALRRQFVFGAGNANGALMIIGEAPGEEEDRQGLPFVGEAGLLLTKMLAAIKVDRKNDVFITNILKCRPPGNRDPEAGESQQCGDILAGQIRIIAPRLILVLGRTAAQKILHTSESLAKLRGRIHTHQGIPAIVTYHPSALLRYPQYKPAAWEDLKLAQQFLIENRFYEQT
jgi:uracil-DNA glycosylase family 4